MKNSKSNELRKALPYLKRGEKSYSKESIKKAYQEVYKKAPDFLKAIGGFSNERKSYNIIQL